MKLQVLTSLLLVVLVVLPTPSWSYSVMKLFTDSEPKINEADKPTSTIQLLELNLEKEWAQFKDFFRRAFNSKQDESARKGVFEENLKTILRHNYLYSRGLTSYAMAVNQFTDMTTEEFRTYMVGSGKMNKTNKGSTFLPPANLKVVPEEVDWRKEGYVTPVKDQGSCGSCWAFSSTGAIEGQHFRKTGKLVSLSEQNLIDCSGTFENKGCNGGLMDQAFEYVKNNSGIDTEKAYPYKGVEQKCRFKKNAVGATVTGFVDVESGNEEQLKQAIATVGPVSVAINAGLESFQHYKYGVFDDENCDPDTLNHGVLAVGYGTENGKDYWLVKNSWGAHWGDKGYIKMVRNKSNQCGIAGAASYPLV